MIEDNSKYVCKRELEARKQEKGTLLNQKSHQTAIKIWFKKS